MVALQMVNCHKQIEGGLSLVPDRQSWLHIWDFDPKPMRLDQTGETSTSQEL
jgi:hypothetical protein